MTPASVSSSSSSPPLDWKFSQVFGERLPGEDLQEADVISAIEFESSGKYLAVGDKGGRVVIFDRHDGKDRMNHEVYRSELEHTDFPFVGSPEYHYKTEFQSHEPEFDYLKSLEIEEKINKLRWCPTQNGSLFILSTNDKTIKLWKIKDRKARKRKELDSNPAVYSESSLFAERSYMSVDDQHLIANGHHMESTERPFEEADSKIAYVGDSARASCRKVFAHAHDFNINSISNNSDGETFVSADDLRINLWNLEISDQCFNIIDMKPSNMEDLTEVITSAEFHPTHCNLLAYSSSRGFIRLVDLRQSAICDHNAKILQDAECHGSKSFFTEIIASISDMKFTNDGKHILSRDYLTLKLWDIRMDSSPVAVFNIHEHLRPKLCDLYNNDSIFDKFECCVSGDGLNFATGSYSNLLRVFSHGVGNEEGITIEATKNPNRKPLLRSSSRARRSSLSNLTRGFHWQGHENSNTGGNEFSCDLSSKMLHLAWHPTMNFIACASGNSLFMYHA